MKISKMAIVGVMSWTVIYGHPEYKKTYQECVEKKDKFVIDNADEMSKCSDSIDFPSIKERFDAHDFKSLNQYCGREIKAMEDYLKKCRKKGFI